MTAAQPESIDEFFQTIQSRAFRMAQMSLGNEDDALDLLQDVMFRFYQSYHDAGQASWRPLFFTVLTNAINDFHRRRFRWQKVKQLISGKPEASSALDEQLMQQQGLEHITRGIQLLPPRQRQVFLLRCWEGLPVKDVASLAGISEGSVKTHYARAVARLQNELEEYLP